jgi:hypothetical protein
MALKPLNVKVNADTDGLEKGLVGASKSVDKFSDRTKVAAVSVAKAAAAMTAAFAAVGVGVLALANEAAKAAREIQNLSDVSGVGVEEFQRMAAASRTVGIEQQKLADIFKDVNDKFGDFNQTGAGPLADFFENVAPLVGVTADEFARLSGPEALQLYVSSLEKAGASQQQMTFYMEALASDATALVPLLSNGGSAMRELGNEAQRSGRILSSEMIQNGVELDRVLDDVASTLRTSLNKAVLDNADDLAAFATVLADVVIPAVANFVSGLADIVGGIANVSAAAVQGAKDLLDFLNQTDAVASTGSRGRRGRRNGTEGGSGGDVDIDGIIDDIFGNSFGSGGQGGGRGGVVRSQDDVLPPLTYGGRGQGPQGQLVTTEVPSITLPSRSDEDDEGGGGDGGSGGGGSRLTDAESLAEELEARLEVLTEGLATESELVQSWYDEGVQTLQDAKAAELLTEEEYRLQRERLEEEHQRRINGIKKAGAMADLALLVGAGAEVLGALGENNEKALKLAQAFGAAQALISAYQGAAEALKLPFPANIAAAATVLAKGIGFVAAIKGVSKGGGGSGSGASIGGAAASGGGAGGGGNAGQAPTTTFSFQLQNDPMGFGESFARQVVAQLNEANRNGAQVRGVIG